MKRCAALPALHELQASSECFWIHASNSLNRILNGSNAPYSSKVHCRNLAVQRPHDSEQGTSPASIVIENLERRTSAVRKQMEDLKFELPGNPLSRQQDTATLAAPAGPAAPRHIIYRGPMLFLIRFLVRAKVLQILGIFAGVVLVSSAFGSQGQGDAVSPSIAAAVLLGCVVTSYCLWFYSSRYVGEMSLLLPDRRTARFSVLDFWGNRQDVDVPVADIQPPFQSRSNNEIRQLASRTLLPITISSGRQFYLSIPHGAIRDKETLEKLCYGTWLQHLDQEPGHDQVHETTDHTGSPAGQDVLQRQQQQQKQHEKAGQ